MGTHVSFISPLASSPPAKGRLAKVGRPQDVKNGLSAAVDVSPALLWVHVRLLLVEGRLWHCSSKHLSRVLVPYGQNLGTSRFREMSSVE